MSFEVGLLVAGCKGRLFLEGLLKDITQSNPLGLRISLVSSYEVKGTQDESNKLIKSLCEQEQINFVSRQDLNKDGLAICRIILVAGWQFMLEETDDRFIILHDSLLPKLRGFNPTVTALIIGQPNIGVTALKPNANVDEGAVYGSESCDISYPIKIADAYHRLANTYCKLTLNLLRDAQVAALHATPQDASEATYSLWRDEADYNIDWSSTSIRIRRFVDALGWPYLHAKTIYQGRSIRILDAIDIGDLDFPMRASGKLWSIGREGGLADVVCGQGMLRILDAREEDGRTVVFDRLRCRLGA